MNIAQIKQDLANGVMIGRETWRELVDYTLKLEETASYQKPTEGYVLESQYFGKLLQRVVEYGFEGGNDNALIEYIKAWGQGLYIRGYDKRKEEDAALVSALKGLLEYHGILAEWGADDEVNAARAALVAAGVNP